MRKMRRIKKLHHTQRHSRNRVFIFTSGGVVTVLALILVLVFLENPSRGTGSLNTESPSIPTQTGSSIVKQDLELPREDPLTFYSSLKKDETWEAFPWTFEGETFDPLTPPYVEEGYPFKHTGYTIQVAAMANKTTAETLAKRLRRKGFASHILPLAVPNRGTLFRVRIGGFRSKSEAEKWAIYLKQEEGLSPFVTHNKGIETEG